MGATSVVPGACRRPMMYRRRHSSTARKGSDPRSGGRCHSMVASMATWDDVGLIAATLPETTETTGSGGVLAWRVRDKSFAWERPLSMSDIEALGDTGPVLAAHVPDLSAKDALLAEDPDVYFTTPHFDGYRAILVRLDRIAVPDLRELLVEAWLCRAPKRLVASYLEPS
jgi:hypothetical protein